MSSLTDRDEKKIVSMNDLVNSSNEVFSKINIDNLCNLKKQQKKGQKKTRRGGPLEVIDVQSLLQTQINTIKIVDEIIEKEKATKIESITKINGFKEKHATVSKSL